MTLNEIDEKLSPVNEISYKSNGVEIQLKTTWGLFSPKEVDYGTDLLIRTVRAERGATILDLCCGYGVAGIAVGKRDLASLVHFVDKDFVALDFTRRNIELNFGEVGVNNESPMTDVYLSNMFSHISTEQKFDLIVSNLPAKVGKELFKIMLEDAKAHLNPGGKFVVVTIAGLREYIKRNFKETFGNYTKLAQDRGFAIMEAVL